jgi:hypothetical protein
MAMAQDHLEAFSICYKKAVHRLSKVGGLGLFQLDPMTMLSADRH